MAFTLSVVAPDRTVFEGQVKSIVLPGSMGYFGVQSNHEPLIAALRVGIIEFTDINEQRSYVTVSGGFAEVSDNKVTVLAEDARHAAEIDVAGAEVELEEARKALRGEQSTMTTEEATQAVERAMLRIKVAKRTSTKV